METAQLAWDAGTKEVINEDILRRLLTLISGWNRPDATRLFPTIDTLEYLKGTLGERGHDEGTVLQCLLKCLEKGIVHHSARSSFTWFNPSISVPAAIADLLVSLYNPQLATYESSPACYEIEQLTLSTIAEWCEISEFTGHFTQGGAESNLTALQLALNYRLPDFRERGLTRRKSLPTFYLSRNAHLSVMKALRVSGIADIGTRWIAVNSRGEIEISDLERQIKEDLNQGHFPIAIIGNFGTTAEGAIDDHASLSRIARSHGMWLHLDAAWGGGALVAGVLKLEHSDFDSISIDAHKMLCCPLGTGMIFTRHHELLRQAFGLGADYELNHNHESLFEHSLQWSRRFIGARLFCFLATYGRAGLRKIVEHYLSMATLFSQLLEAKDWKILPQSKLPIVCFRSRGALSTNDSELRRIYQQSLLQNEFGITLTKASDGLLMLRAAMNSFQTSDEDIRNCVDMITRIRDSV